MVAKPIGGIMFIMVDCVVLHPMNTTRIIELNESLFVLDFDDERDAKEILFFLGNYLFNDNI